MAANRGGINQETLQTIDTREELVAYGAALLSTQEEEGKRIDFFRIPKQNGSLARALINGVLDLSTGFLWELAATPMETAFENKSFYTLKVTFDQEDKLEKIEIL